MSAQLDLDLDFSRCPPIHPPTHPPTKSEPYPLISAAAELTALAEAVGRVYTARLTVARQRYVEVT